MKTDALHKCLLVRLMLLLETVNMYDDLYNIDFSNNVEELIDNLESKKKEIDEKMKKGEIK